MKFSKKIFASVVCLAGLFITVTAQNSPFVWLDSKTLRVTDGISEQVYLWEKGTLTILQARSLSGSEVDVFSSVSADRSSDSDPTDTFQKTDRVEATERTSAYSQIDLHVVFPDYELVRSLRVYDDCPGVEWRLSMKGRNSLFPVVSSSGSDLVENPALLSGNAPYYHFLPFSSPHYTTEIVSFREATDHHSNIIRSRTELPYRKPQYYEGNALIAKNNHKNEVHLVVKQSPLQDAQSAYTGFDFSTDFSGIKVHSPGFDFQHVSGKDSGWQESYPLFTVMYAGDEKTALNLYKKYELTVHRYLPHMDNTFTMNTWGDRNRDSRINEPFILNELEAASRLGITHYQIDDGWQQGLSRNSAEKANMLWDDWSASDWDINNIRFPNGLGKVKEKAASLGISLGLWFNPSKNEHYAAWERDKDILTGLHSKHDISWIKIDGLEIGNKLAESRVGQMLGGAAAESGSRLQFNMDVTAGKRGGYFYFNRFGNIFLENRYTDWGNYYPHLTLRNIWSLAEYIPIQRIQIEWLNKWRNEKQYPKDDPLKPANIPFDYQFAITMMGQPLAWMEATGLPDEAFEVRGLIDIWKSERSRMQQGVISPLGQIPDGYSFPGFVSRTENRIYVLLFRENTSHSTGKYDLLQDDIENMKFIKLAGDGNLNAVHGSTVEVNFSNPFQFLWGYFVY